MVLFFSMILPTNFYLALIKEIENLPITFFCIWLMAVL